MSTTGKTPASGAARGNRGLGVEGKFHPQFGDNPLFPTVTKTRGEHSHTDMSFWFVLATHRDMRIEADPREANEVRWFDLDDPTQTDRSRTNTENAPGLLRPHLPFLGE